MRAATLLTTIQAYSVITTPRSNRVAEPPARPGECEMD